MNAIDLVLLLAMAIGLASILVPILPGTLIIGVATLIWASESESGSAWLWAAIAIVILVIGAVVKFVIPGRRLSAVGIGWKTQAAGFVLGIVGFFVIPVIGLFIGFVAGVWFAEAARLGAGEATRSTRHALAAAGLSILIDLVAALIAVAITVAGMVVLS